MIWFVGFVWFYGAHTQFSSYVAETGKMILANLMCHELKQHQGPKPPHLLKPRDAWTQIIWTHSVAFYDHAAINGEGNIWATKGGGILWKINIQTILYEIKNFLWINNICIYLNKSHYDSDL
jgi:hypothetical protein